MASQPGVFNLQCLTDAGLPAASYRLYTYTQGTTTHKTAYTDAAGSVAHTYTSDGAGGSYIALNARGELPSPLFLTSGAYDLALKTQAGVTVWTRRAIGIDDGGLSISADLANDASTSKGSSLIGSLRSLAGAIGATLQDRLGWAEVNMLELLSKAKRTDVLSGTASLDVGLEYQAIINDFGGGGVRFIVPPGVSRMITPIVVAQNGVEIVGLGKNVSRMVFDPASSGQSCIKFSRGASVIYEGGLRDLWISGTGTLAKTAAELSDISSFDMSRVQISAMTDTATRGSYGLVIKGRECSSFSGLKIDADNPIRIANNPNYTIDCNEISFRDLYLIANNTAGACILVDDGVYFSGAVFEGHQSWVHGKYGFYWSNTTDPSASQNLHFKHIWREQSDNVAGYTIYISNTSGNIQAVSVNNAALDSACNGIYLRGVRRVSVRDSLYPGAHEAWNVDGTVLSTVFDNFNAATGSTATLTNQVLARELLRSVSGSPFGDAAWYYSISSFANVTIPTVSSAATIAVSKAQKVVFVSGVATISTITPWSGINGDDNEISLIPTGLWSTNTAGNIALASTAVVNKVLKLVYDTVSMKWFPSY